MHTSRTVLTSLTAAVLTAVAALPAAAADPPPERVSVATGGGQGSGPSQDPAVSRDGRVVAFASDAEDLVPGTAPGTDVFVRDTVAGTTRLVSPHGGRRPTISLDGRYVGFVSDAADLVPGDTNGAPDAFRVDLATGAVVRTSLDAQGRQVPTGVTDAVLTGDGAHVVFRTRSRLAQADRSPEADLYLRDLTTGRFRLVSHATGPGSDEDTAGAAGWNPTASANGRWVAYRALSTGPGAPYTVWLRDTRDDVSRDLVRAAGFTTSDDDASATAVSPDGRWVGFTGDAWGRPDDLTEDDDVWLYSTERGAFRRVTGPDGGAFHTFFPTSVSIANRARRVAWYGGFEDGLTTWVWDRDSGRTTQVATLPYDDAFQHHGGVALSADGARLAFVTDVARVAGDTNAASDVHLQRLPG